MFGANWQMFALSEAKLRFQTWQPAKHQHDIVTVNVLSLPMLAFSTAQPHKAAGVAADPEKLCIWRQVGVRGKSFGGILSVTHSVILLKWLLMLSCLLWCLVACLVAATGKCNTGTRWDRSHSARTGQEGTEVRRTFCNTKKMSTKSFTYSPRTKSVELNWLCFGCRWTHFMLRDTSGQSVQLLSMTHYMPDSVYLLTVKQNASRGYLRFWPTLCSTLCLASMSHTHSHTQPHTHTPYLYRALI